MAWNGVIVCDHYFLSEDFRHYCLGKLTSADPVAEVGREPADDDLVRVLVPEEGEAYAVAVLMPVDALQMKLHEHPLCVSDEVVDVFSIAFQPVRRGTCQWNQRSQCRIGRVHPGTPCPFPWPCWNPVLIGVAAGIGKTSPSRCIRPWMPPVLLADAGAASMELFFYPLFLDAIGISVTRCGYHDGDWQLSGGGKPCRLRICCFLDGDDLAGSCVWGTQQGTF